MLAMHDFFRETTFGRIVHLASRGKLFPATKLDPSKIQRYTMISSASISITVENAAADTPKGAKIDRENGSNFQLVEWDENDPEV